MSQLLDIVMPESQDEGTESVVATWLVKLGEVVEANEPVLEISTDKVTLEVAAPATGVLREIIKDENEPVEPSDILGRLEPVDAGSVATETETQSAPVETPAAAASDASAQLTPAVRRMLKEHNLDASQISGSGRGGRITVEDVEKHVAGGSATKSSSSSNIPSERKAHSQMRRRIASHMVESMLKTAPHVTAIFDADLTNVVSHRNANKDAFAERGAKLTFTAYFVQATVKAMQAVPEANSRWHDDALELFQTCNVGIAAAIDEGLIVPVLKGAEKLDLFDTAKQLQELTEKARGNSLAPSDVQDGTFTITNHGVSGSLIATPIINQPQSAILGIGKLEKRVVVVEENGEDSMQIKPMVYVTLTIDHRALDGFTANQFLSTFVETLEQWPAA